MWIQGFSVLICAALTAVAATHVPVQAQESRDGGRLEEIIVTAQKIEQSIVDMPISMTVTFGLRFTCSWKE